jgi:hypothetical protein
MFAATNVIEFPVRRDGDVRDALERDIVPAPATADDLAAAMDRVVESVFLSSGANRVEWWSTRDDGTA